MLVFIGTYTRAASRGIYCLRFDPEAGALSEPSLAAEARNPTFLAKGPSGHIYATGDLAADPAQGCLRAFAAAPDGHLELLSEQATGVGATTHVAADATGRMAVTVSFSGGYVAALPIQADGRLGPPAFRFEPAGQPGPNRERQDRPHAHSVTVSPDNRFALVCDLGLDRVFIFRIYPADARMEPNEPAAAAAPPGSGPRHAKFSADGRFFYVSNEMGGTVCVFAYDASRGRLTLLQTIPTLPLGFSGTNTVGEIRVHPNGRFVYVSNRGHESLAVFARDLISGSLSLVEIVPCGGRHPRNFALSPDGRWLLCANRDTDNVVVHHVDLDTGRLVLSGAEAPVSQPVCVLFTE